MSNYRRDGIEEAWKASVEEAAQGKPREWVAEGWTEDGGIPEKFTKGVTEWEPIYQILPEGGWTTGGLIAFLSRNYYSCYEVYDGKLVPLRYRNTRTGEVHVIRKAWTSGHHNSRAEKNARSREMILRGQLCRQEGLSYEEMKARFEPEAATA